MCAVVVAFMVILPLLACATYGQVDAARWRAYHELGCDEIYVTQRVDLSPATFDAAGCGKSVRYTCTWERQGRFRGTASPVCVPEVQPSVEARVAVP